MVLIAWIVNKITDSKRRQSQSSLMYWIIYFISIWTSQGITLRNPSAPIRIVFAVAFFGVYIVSNYFTAAYTSVLSIPNLKPSVSSIEELANTESVIALLNKGSNTDEYIMTSTDPTMKKISDKMRRHPERRILNAFNVKDISTIVKDGFALALIKSNAESMIQASYRLNKKCLVTLAEKTFFPRLQGFTYPKNSPLVPIMDHYILLMHQSGLIQYAERRSTSHNPCDISDIRYVTASKPVPLRLRDLFGVFVIYFAGIVPSLLIFLAELIAARLAKEKNTQAIKVDVSQQAESQPILDPNGTISI